MSDTRMIGEHGRSGRRLSGAAFLLVFVGTVFVGGSLQADALRDATKSLVRGLQTDSPKDVKSAVAEMVAIGGKKSLTALVKIVPKIPPSQDLMYWTIVEGICSFADVEALEEIGSVVIRYARTPLARDLMYGLAKNTSPNVFLAMKPVLLKGPPDLQYFAVEKLGKIYTQDAVAVLIEALEQEEKKVKDVRASDLIADIVDALGSITGQRFGPNSINWKGWWEKNRDTAPLGREAGAGDQGHGGTVVDSLKRKRQEEFFGLEKAPKKGVVVLSAEYDKPQRNLNNDHIERVLGRMKVPHTVVKRPDFEKYDLRGVGALVINCAQFHEFCICPTCKPGGTLNNRLYRCTGCNKHEKFSAQLSRKSIDKIVRFVRGGGYVFAEDWVVKELLEKAWPKYVQTGLVLRKTAVPNVDVVPARGRATHPYLRGIFVADEIDVDDLLGGEDDDDDEDEGTTVTKKPKKEEKKDAPPARMIEIKHRWAIDDESWAFDVTEENKVLVLMTSGELQQKAAGQGIVAFAFAPGGNSKEIGKPGSKSGKRAKPRPGVVLQVLSHFGKQGSTRDEYLLQNILLNFLIDANVQRTRRFGPDPKPDKGKKAEEVSRKE